MDNYESKYNDIINRLRKAKEDDSVNDDRYCCVIDDIVPELKESDDERIRKALINGFNKLDKSAVWYNGITNGQILAWLEKQCEQNLPIEKLPFEMKTVSESLGFTTQKECDDYNKMVTDHIMSDDGKGEQKPANKVEPKFKIGDNIEPIDSCLGSPRTIYKICDGFYETNQGTLNFEFENNWRLIEQKSAWSEEDERNMGGIVSDLEYLKDKANAKTLKERFQDKIDWLKSLRPQNRWKPSESQLEALDDFIYAKYPNIEKYEASVKSLYQDLKKLKG